MVGGSTETFDVFLSHSHEDSNIVEKLAAKLQDARHFRVWLDKWILVPGNDWQREMAQGLEKAKTCGVCISRNTPSGWFREEIARALNRQSKDPSFRVIPIILPNGDNKIVDDFLELRTWVDFKDGIDDGYSLHVLASGILGESPGRYPAQQTAINAELAGVRPILQGIKALREEQLIDENIAIELQRRVVYPIFVLGK